MKYDITEIQDFLMIHIVGDMTSLAHLSILEEGIKEHIGNGFHKFLFHLENVDTLDNTGIGIFIDCLTDVDVHGGGCYLLVESEDVYAILERAGIVQLMKVYRSSDEFAEEHGISITD